MNKIGVLIFAFVVGVVAAIIAGFTSDKAVFMGQFILTLGIILYADVTDSIEKLRDEVNKNERYRKKNKS